MGAGERCVRNALPGARPPCAEMPDGSNACTTGPPACIAPLVYHQQGNLADFHTSRCAPRLDQHTSFDDSAMSWPYHNATEHGGGYEGYHRHDLAGDPLAYRSPTPHTTAPGSTVTAVDAQPSHWRARC